jgi:hypothetical protein
MGHDSEASKASSEGGTKILVALLRAHSGQLFGFERVHELLRKGKSASEAAGEAQGFGQEDDAVLEPALA